VLPPRCRTSSLKAQNNMHRSLHHYLRRIREGEGRATAEGVPAMRSIHRRYRESFTTSELSRPGRRRHAPRRTHIEETCGGNLLHPNHPALGAGLPMWAGQVGPAEGALGVVRGVSESIGVIGVIWLRPLLRPKPTWVASGGGGRGEARRCLAPGEATAGGGALRARASGGEHEVRGLQCGVARLPPRWRWPALLGPTTIIRRFWDERGEGRLSRIGSTRPWPCCPWSCCCGLRCCHRLGMLRLLFPPISSPPTAPSTKCGKSRDPLQSCCNL